MNSNQTLVQTLPSAGNDVVRNVTMAIIGSLALWLSAKIQVPFYPVPMTMQTFVVLVIGMACGWRLGGATILLYLAEGAVGLPVFAGTPERGMGLAYMMGPTGGYLMGFFCSAVLVGWLAERGWDRRIITALAAMILGTAVIFAFGVLWLGSVVGWNQPVLDLGLFPFIPGAVFKIVLAAAVLPAIWHLVQRNRQE